MLHMCNSNSELNAASMNNTVNRECPRNGNYEEALSEWCMVKRSFHQSHLRGSTGSGDGEGQGSLSCCSQLGHKWLDTTD